jgi:uncharacterized protein YfaS (alpha-2-macroglobulin family)
MQIKKSAIRNGLLFTAGFVAVIAAIFFLRKSDYKVQAVASGPDELYEAYVSSYTAGIISKKSNILVRLVENVYQEGKYDEPIDQSLFSFEPSVKGEAYWLDEGTVEFRPENPLESGKQYSVKFKLGKLVHTPDDLKEFDFSFRTIRQNFEVQLEGLKVYEQKDLKRQKLIGRLVTADIADSDQVEKMLGAEQDGKALEINWSHEIAANMHEFIVQEVMRGEKEGEVLLNVDGAPIEVDEDQGIEVPVPALGDFKVMETKVVQSPQQYVLLIFSDPLLKNQDFEGLVQIEGASNLRFSVDENELKVYPYSRMSGRKAINIRRGIKNLLGYELKEGDEITATFEQVKPSVRMVGNGVILPSTDGMVMPFEAVSLRAVDVRVVRVFQSNILQFFQRNTYNGSNELKRVGKIVANKTVRLDAGGLTDLGKWNRFHLDLSDLISLEPGAIYQVEIGYRKKYSVYYCDGEIDNQPIDPNQGFPEVDWSGPDRDYSYWDNYYDNGDYNWRDRDNPCTSSYYRLDRAVSRNILASDIGLIAKMGSDNNLLISVTDLIAAEPKSGVRLEVYDYQQQLLGKSQSGSDGTSAIKLPSKPFMLVAYFNEQRGYLRLDDGMSLSLSNFNVSGTKVKEGVKGFIYGERGVWRPGDAIHLCFILEDKQDRLPKDHPVIFEFYDPRGQLVEKKVKTESVNGIYNFTTATDPEAATGNWHVKVAVGSAEFNKQVKIETVKPNRLKINLDFGVGRFTWQERTASADLNVKWLHGAPAKNLEARFNVTLVPVPATFEDFPNHTFTDESKQYDTETLEVFDGILDATGHANVSVKLDPDGDPPGALMASFEGKVFEESGNFSIDRFNIPFYPYRNYVGIQLPKGDHRGMLLTDTTHTIRIASVDGMGNPVSIDRMSVEIYKLDWKWWWDQSSNTVSSYLGRRYRDPVFTSYASTSNGQGTATFRINYPKWGRYYVKVCDDAGGHCAGKVVYIDWPGWAGRGKREFPGGANMLSFNTNKETYGIGEKVRVTLPGAKNGKAFVTVENGSKVLQSIWVDTEEGESSFTFETTPEMTPNAYVSIMLLQPHSQTANDLPIRLYGVVNINVEDKENHLYPEIAMPDAIEPGQDFTVEVSERNGKPMAYTIAIVDEGLLDLTRYKTPDPYETFYAREALGVKTWDLFDDVIGAYGGKLERLLAIGGGMDEANARKSKANRFKPVVLFKGPFYLGKNDEEKHTFTMPQYIGSVRTMVVAADNGKYGFADQATPVKQDLMVLGTLPRVLGPDEKVQLPVTVFAMKSQLGQVKVTVKSNDLLMAGGAATQTLNFTEEGEKMAMFDFTVAPKTGIARVEIEASSGSKKAVHNIELDVRNPNPPMTNVFEAVIEPGQQHKFDFSAVGMAGTNTAALEVSAIPPINLQQRLGYLIRYPHGCIEQTISSVFPQLYLPDLADLKPAQKQRLEENVKKGIERLKSFQLNSGGFAYWPGNLEHSEWGSSYAAHFLIEARNKGYAVPGGMLRKWERFQKGLANEWTQNNQRYYNRDLQQAYRLYTLALNNSPAKGAMNRMRELPELSTQAHWVLASAYAKAGMPEAASALINGQTTDIKEYRQLSYTYGSTIRDKSLIVETLLLLNKRTEAFELVRAISERLSDHNRWMSTQTTAFALRAVSQYAIGDAKNRDIDVDYVINGASDNIETGYSTALQDIEIKSSRSNTATVTNNGETLVYARITNTGVPLRGEETAAENNLRLNVRYTDLKGNTIDPAVLDQGADFIAEVEVYNPGIRGELKELALTQIFPSGWEIHNERLTDSPQTFQQSAADYRDIRDDRVMTYFNLGTTRKKIFRVQLNASYAGTFYLPAVLCEAMYDNTINARAPGKEVQVNKIISQ